MRFFYRQTLGRDDVPASLAPVKQPRSLPVVLGPDELARSFAAVKNLKHRALLMTACAAGLRFSGVTRLRVADIDGARMVIRVRHGKGQEERYVILSPRPMEILRAYWKAARPGYAHSTVRERLRLWRDLARWLDQHSLPLADLNEPVADQFLERRRRQGRLGSGDAATLHHSLERLREAGAIRSPEPAADESLRGSIS